jgi:hypothetical protein
MSAVGKLPYFAIISIVFLAISCGSKKSVPADVKTPEVVKNFYTDLVINYRLDKSGIRDTFNNAINEIFKGTFDIPEYDIKMSLSKPKPASVEIEGKSVLVVVPIGVNVNKNTFLANLSAKGVIEMSFITDLEIDSLWNLKTKTNLSFHRWVEKPKLSVGGISLPIETISDAVIKKSKLMIEQTIDESVKESFTLKAKMQETMSMFDQAFRVSPDVNGWINIKPEKFQINKVINNKFSAIGKINIKGLTQFTTYKPEPKSKTQKLPPVFWNENIPDSSVFRVVADIKTSDINPMIKANLDGKTFTEGGKSITLSNIVTNCDYEFMRVVTDVTGSVNGMLIIKGKPKYNAAKNEFAIENIDIQLKTKNVIHKAAAWIAEGKIRSEMEKQLKFSINDFLIQAQNNIDDQLKAFNTKYDLEMRIGIGSGDVESFELKPGQIEAILKTKFFLEMRIKDFRSFNKF